MNFRIGHMMVSNSEVWDNEDFIIYFEGHWETWEFNKETQSVRCLDCKCVFGMGCHQQKVVQRMHVTQCKWCK